MAVTQYKDLSWGATEPLDTDKLNTMVDNSRYNFEHAAKMYFTAYGVKKDTGIRIASGVATIPPNKNNSQYVNVPFGSFFSTGCKPVIATSITSPYNGRVIETIYGLPGVNYLPDNTGFVARVALVELTTKLNFFAKTMYLNWIAFGF